MENKMIEELQKTANEIRSCYESDDENIKSFVPFYQTQFNTEKAFTERVTGKKVNINHWVVTLG